MRQQYKQAIADPGCYLYRTISEKAAGPVRRAAKARALKARGRGWTRASGSDEAIPRSQAVRQPALTRSFGGSNPSAGANPRPHRLVVRTPPSHGGNTGSTPVEATSQNPVSRGFFTRCRRVALKWPTGAWPLTRSAGAPGRSIPCWASRRGAGGGVSRGPSGSLAPTPRAASVNEPSRGH
jgi:hypothetical protein